MIWHMASFRQKKVTCRKKLNVRHGIFEQGTPGIPGIIGKVGKPGITGVPAIVMPDNVRSPSRIMGVIFRAIHY